MASGGNPESPRAAAEPRRFAHTLELDVVGKATPPVRLGDDEDRASVQLASANEKPLSTAVVQLQVSNDEREWTNAPASVASTSTITGSGIIVEFVAGAYYAARLVVTTAESNRVGLATWTVRRAAAAVRTGEALGG